MLGQGDPNHQSLESVGSIARVEAEGENSKQRIMVSLAQTETVREKGGREETSFEFETLFSIVSILMITSHWLKGISAKFFVYFSISKISQGTWQYFH